MRLKVRYRLEEATETKQKGLQHSHQKKQKQLVDEIKRD